MRLKYLLAIGVISFVALLALVSTNVSGQSGAPSRIREAIDNTNLTVLQGNVHPLASAQFDRGAAPASLPMDHMLLVLTRSPDQQAALENLLAQQQDRSSPNYHNWLTPQQFGQQFGPSDQDVQKITAWLQSQGFHVNEVAAGHTAIDFSGSAGQVQQAFHAAIHSYVLANGEQHWANATNPRIPTALTPVVAGVHSLNNFPRKRMSHTLGVFRRSKTDGKVTAVHPNFTYSASTCDNTTAQCYALGPADFYKIYNLPSTATGSGQTIAVVSDSDINSSDVVAFRSIFGLPAMNFTQIETEPTSDPGVLNCANGGDECEAVLDVEWSGAVATGATIDLVVSPSTNSTFGGDTSAQYIVNNNLAPILSYSYGQCELFLGTSGNTFYQQLWSQAAAQGITVLVSTGDNGSSACDPLDPSVTIDNPAQFGLAVNGVSSTPYNIAVGGTDFNDFSNPTTYWSASNASGTQASVLGYIPETAYNDTCTNSVIYTFFGFSSAEASCNSSTSSNDGLIFPAGGAGGASNCTTSATSSTAVGAVSSCGGGYAKPSWQTGPGVPSDGKRDVPDLSLFAGDGTIQNFYIVCEADANPDGSTNTCNLNSPYEEFEGVGGTSVAVQAFAGVMALIDQQIGSKQGNANPTLYTLAAEQSAASCNSTSSPASTCVFYDVTSGTNAMPCVKNSPNCTVLINSDANGVLSGYNAGTGFDLVTGLGSVNIGNLLTKFGPNFYLSSSAATVTVSSSTPGTATITANSVNGFAGSVSLACSGLPTGATCSFNPTSLTLTANGTATSTLTVSATAAGLVTPSNRPWGNGSRRLAGWIPLALALLVAIMFRRMSSEQSLVSILTTMSFALAIGFAACGGGGANSGTSTPITTATPNIAGNWTFTATSSSFGTQYSGVGTVAQNGSTMSAALALSGTPCASSAALSGSLNGDSITMTLNENGQVVTLTGTVASNGNSASGSYSAAAGGCTNGDMGTWAGTRTSVSTTPAPVAGVSPTTLTFSNQNISTSSAAQAITLSNSGTASLSITTITTSGDFAQSNNCGTSVANGAPPCTIQVTFTPTASGARTGSLTIQDNAANSPQTVTLSGTGVATSMATITGTSGNLSYPLNITVTVQ